jgi:hypothetical protein
MIDMTMDAMEISKQIIFSMVEFYQGLRHAA